MTKLPTTRQSPPRKPSRADHQSLAHAFLTFTQAAGSLEKSYTQLQTEVGRLRAELEVANAELSRSLEETSRVRAFLSRVLEGLPCGVLVTDGEGRPRLINPEARRLLELDADWRPEINALIPDSIGVLLGEIAPNCFDAETEWAPEILRERRILGVAATTVDASSNSETETIWILRDVSDQKRAASEREAARRAHALAEVAAVLAHELRNPLGSMELFAGLLAGATAGMPQASEWVNHLRAGLRSLSGTVNNVLQFHGPSCGELLPTCLDRLVRETAEFLGPLARERGLKIAIENTAGQVFVNADSQRLQQVFFNLSLNAFHAMKESGALTIELRRTGDASEAAVEVNFRDRGCGIRRELLDTIFEPGFTSKAGSPGLGLSVCRKIVEQHGGGICAHSSGLGSTFSISLPVSKGSQ